MGLDQYAFARPPGQIFEDKEIMYCRKHYALEDYMFLLAIEKKLIQSKIDFNGVELFLNKSDLIHLREKIKQGNIHYDPTVSFKVREKDLAFIDDALRYIDEGYTIVYYSSW